MMTPLIFAAALLALDFGLFYFLVGLIAQPAVVSTGSVLSGYAVYSVWRLVLGLAGEKEGR